ncbi:acyl-CoA thioesterase [Campylobacter concisus]|uniref:4-hydroxybenzoyl-CoA thioesterase domain protein n=1 Tax=Campylobacter concisus ATCC 51562 TaxID=1242969 RepID=U2F8M8_9BACT|nr:acyl-CoA thioesterase [Campylobacter concisus]ERJ26642.1 4-hydroxybenzoyl-CoA thioesterase domain protein [Campylobacter concisus ATCC 51562]
MEISHVSTFKVAFFDVDSMEVMWHGNYVKYLEMARCELLDKLGYNYIAMKKDGYAFPIVKLDVKYVRPAFFNDTIKVTTTLNECETFLKFHYLIENEKGEKLSEANTAQAVIDMKSLQTCFEMPEALIKAIKAYTKKENL